MFLHKCRIGSPAAHGGAMPAPETRGPPPAQPDQHSPPVPDLPPDPHPLRPEPASPELDRPSANKAPPPAPEDQPHSPSGPEQPRQQAQTLPVPDQQHPPPEQRTAVAARKIRQIRKPVLDRFAHGTSPFCVASMRGPRRSAPRPCRR